MLPDNNVVSERVEVATRFFDQIKYDLRAQGRLFLQLGKSLKLVRDEELYTLLDFASFDEFINDPEIGLKRATAYLYIRIYEYYSLRLTIDEEELTQIPISRLMRLLPALKKMDDKQAKEKMQEIGKMTTWDYESTVRQEKLESNRPLMYRSKETGKYIIEFFEEDVEKVYNNTNKEILFGDV